MVVHKIQIKALSVNLAWMGRRFKTQAYKDYEQELSLLLPNKGKFKHINWTEQLEFILEVGYSNKNADVDNFLKPFLDVCQNKYLFNDNKIYKLVVEKKIVKKGCEYIRFSINNI